MHTYLYYFRLSPCTCLENDAHQSDLSPVHSHRPAQKDRVYTVATDRTIRTVMAEYRRRKQTHLLPRSSTAASAEAPGARRKSSRSSKVTAAEKEVVATAAAAARGRSMSTSSDPVERQIVEQERASIMKVRACRNIGW